MRHKQSTQPARASNPALRELLRSAVQRGWTVTGGGQRHYKLACPRPCRCAYVLAASSSDRSALNRALVRLTRYTCWKDDSQP